MNGKTGMLPALVLIVGVCTAAEVHASGPLFGPGVTEDGQWSTFSLCPWWWQSKGCLKNGYSVMHYWTPAVYRFYAFHRATTYTYPRDLEPGVPISRGTYPYHCRAVPPAVFFPETYPSPVGSNSPLTPSSGPGASPEGPALADPGQEGPELGMPERLPPPVPTPDR